MIVLDFRFIRDEAIAHLRLRSRRREVHNQIRMRVFRGWQRHHITYRIGMALTQIIHIAEIQRTQRAGFHADGAPALRHALRTAIAFRTLAHLGIDGRRMIRTRDGAIPAADAFVRVDAHQLQIVFMHGARRAHVHTFRIRAMVARKRYVVAKRRSFSSAVGGKLARATFVVNHATIFAACGKAIEVDARHLASAATRAT